MSNLNAAAFDNAAVAEAVNPSAFGYHYGPIPNNNEGWVPKLPEGRTVPVAEDVANPPNAPLTLSTINGGICWVDVGGGICCGKCFIDQPSLRRHTRCEHPGALANPSRRTPNAAHSVAGMMALRNLVVSGRWRTMQFIHEPGRGPVNSIIGQYADACERIAAADPTFAATFGRKFHREFQVPAPAIAGGKKRKRGPQAPPSSDRGHDGSESSGDGSGHGSGAGSGDNDGGDGAAPAPAPAPASERRRAPTRRAAAAARQQAVPKRAAPKKKTAPKKKAAPKKRVAKMDKLPSVHITFSV